MREVHSRGDAKAVFHLQIVSIKYQQSPKPRWGDCLLDRIRPMAPKSKAHIRSVMHLMFECAPRWELFTEQRNPISLVRVKGGFASARSRRFNGTTSILRNQLLVQRSFVSGRV